MNPNQIPLKLEFTNKYINTSDAINGILSNLSFGYHLMMIVFILVITLIAYSLFQVNKIKDSAFRIFTTIFMFIFISIGTYYIIGYVHVKYENPLGYGQYRSSELKIESIKNVYDKNRIKPTFKYHQITFSDNKNKIRYTLNLEQNPHKFQKNKHYIISSNKIEIFNDSKKQVEVYGFHLENISKIKMLNDIEVQEVI